MAGQDQRNIEINQSTWSKVGVMAATLNKSKKTVVTEAIENYFKTVSNVFDMKNK